MQVYLLAGLKIDNLIKIRCAMQPTRGRRLGYF
jgi:hypothetical protein